MWTIIVVLTCIRYLTRLNLYNFLLHFAKHLISDKVFLHKLELDHSKFHYFHHSLCPTNTNVYNVVNQTKKMYKQRNKPDLPQVSISSPWRKYPSWHSIEQVIPTFNCWEEHVNVECFGAINSIQIISNKQYYVVCINCVLKTNFM